MAENEVQQAIDAVLTFFEKKQTKKKVSTQVKQARERGDKVTLKIDPATGVATPTIESRQDMFTGNEDFTLESVTQGGRRFKKKDDPFTPENIRTSEFLAQHGGRGGGFMEDTIEISVGDQKIPINIATDEGRRKAAALRYGEGWEERPELQRLKELLDGRQEEETLIEEAKVARKEKKAQPLAKGLLQRVGGKGAAYKEAVAEYTEETTKKIVDTIIAAQEKGVPLSKIEADLREKGLDPDVFLKGLK